jgi:hypothetical protein
LRTIGAGRPAVQLPLFADAAAPATPAEEALLARLVAEEAAA